MSVTLGRELVGAGLRSREDVDLRLDASREAANGHEVDRAAPTRLPSRITRVAVIVPAFLTAGTFLQPPIGALLAAARLRAIGIDCALIDNRVKRLTVRALAAHLADCDLVCVITTPYDHIQNYFVDYRLRHAFAVARALRKRCPSTPLVVAGAHGTVRPDLVFQETDADFVLRGEVDTTLAMFCDAISSGSEAPPEVVFRGTAVAAPAADGAVPGHRLVDLSPRFRTRRIDDDGLLPAYDLVDLADYYGDRYVGAIPHRQYHWATVLAARGCAFSCDFCFNFWGRSTRRRDPEAVVAELLWLVGDHGARSVFFLDFNFTENRRWIFDLCRAIRRAPVTRWYAQTRCDLVDDEMLREMRAAGCEGLWFGVESFDPDVAGRMSKYGDVGMADRALATCLDAGIKPHIFIMIGSPGETRHSLDRTIGLMHRWKAAYCGVMPAVPRFGTPFYAQAKSQFPALGTDFYGLRAVRGLVGNELRPTDLQDALSILTDRRFIDASVAPRLFDVGGPHQLQGAEL